MAYRCAVGQCEADKERLRAQLQTTADELRSWITDDPVNTGNTEAWERADLIVRKARALVDRDAPGA